MLCISAGSVPGTRQRAGARPRHCKTSPEIFELRKPAGAIVTVGEHRDLAGPCRHGHCLERPHLGLFGHGMAFGRVGREDRLLRGSSATIA
jgi:hypothetical protein